MNETHLPILKDDPNITTVTIALNYLCNSRCRFCFIERELDMKLPDTSDEYLERVFRENRERKRYRRLILAGAEATLRADLPDIARRALEEGGFEVIRLQTNGRRLAKASYLAQLIDAGVQEYFVSVHAGTAELDAHLTRNPLSFREMRAGLENLVRSGARTISNTCVSRDNYEHLGELSDFLLEVGVPESHFWAFIEFGDIGQSDQHVPHAEAIPHVQAAARRLLAAGHEVVLSWFPECALGDVRDRLVDHRDDTLIHDEFSSRAKNHGGFSCPHQERCTHFGKTCIGLHERHVELCGDERELLTPFEGP
ncbi:MAG: radical SAM protein [Myxococcales bacterium]|nr:radical SAM protein [Myxococcales bacterium]MCB9575859.1 radical SAM protein [Polyangiaceae bacterium]